MYIHKHTCLALIEKREEDIQYQKLTPELTLAHNRGCLVAALAIGADTWRIGLDTASSHDVLVVVFGAVWSPLFVSLKATAKVLPDSGSLNTGSPTEKTRGWWI